MHLFIILNFTDGVIRSMFSGLPPVFGVVDTSATKRNWCASTKVPDVHVLLVAESISGHTGGKAAVLTNRTQTVEQEPCWLTV